MTRNKHMVRPPWGLHSIPIADDGSASYLVQDPIRWLENGEDMTPAEYAAECWIDHDESFGDRGPWGATIHTAP